MNWTIGFKAIAFALFALALQVYGARCGCCTGVSVCVHKNVHTGEQLQFWAEKP